MDYNTSSSLKAICEDSYSDTLTVYFDDGCLIMARGSSILNKWCGFQKLFFVAGGYEIVDTIIKPGQTLELFNNDGDIDSSHTLPMGDITGRTATELIDKPYAKSIFMFIEYPIADIAGNKINDKLNTSELTISNIYLDAVDTDPDAVFASDEFVLPMYTFYSLTTNQTCTDVTKMTNACKLKNTTAENIKLSALILYSGGEYGCEDC